MLLRPYGKQSHKTAAGDDSGVHERLEIGGLVAHNLRELLSNNVYQRSVDETSRGKGIGDPRHTRRGDGIGGDDAENDANGEGEGEYEAEEGLQPHTELDLHEEQAETHALEDLVEDHRDHECLYGTDIRCRAQSKADGERVNGNGELEDNESQDR